MFNFLKKIFQKEASETEEVKIPELGSWLDCKLSQIKFEEETVEFFNKLKDQRWILEEKLSLLAEAEINPEKDKVEEKIKNIVLGHKENYLKEMRRFLERLEVPSETSLSRTIVFNADLNSSLDQLSQKTAKSYQAAQHLFFNHVEDVFKVVSEINLLAKGFSQKLIDKRFDKIDEIRTRISSLQGKKRKKEKLEEELKFKEIKLNRCLEGKQKQEKEINRLKESDEYEEFRLLKEKEDSLKSQLKDNNDEVFLFFSQLGRALRKYEKVTLEVKIVKEYLDNAVAAFFKDESLKVVDVLDGLKRSIEKGDVELDEKQKETVFELVKKAKDGYLKEILAKGKELQQKAEEFKAKLRRYNIDRLIEEAEYKQEHFEEQLVLTQREMEELKTKLQSSDREILAKELNELIKDVLKTEVKLIEDPQV